MSSNTNSLFPLGHVVATQGVIALDLPLDTILALLRRHQTGDWGEIGKSALDRIFGGFTSR